MNKGDIIMLPIKQLHAHPENPRKDIGDISELSESIKVNGILQNLTVVPGHYEGNEFCDGEYTVIIGHRRLAAAKKAGLKELPCSVTEMSVEKQVATMLTENMQRENLTVYEQAKAFQQLSIDFGKSVSEIAEMSGFSETTVRRRTKLADLNEVAFKRACDRGATLFDFAELDKLETNEDKAKVLADMGTVNFKNTLKETLAAQKYRHKREEWIASLRSFATEIEQQSYIGDTFVRMNYYRGYGSWTKNEEIIRPEDADSVRYFFTVKDSQITVYKEAVSDPEKEAEQAEQRKKEQEIANRWEQMQDISTRHRELRREFVVGFGQANRHMNSIVKFASDAMLVEAGRQYYVDMNRRDLAELLGIPYDCDNKCLDEEEFDRIKSEKPLWVLLAMGYWYCDKSKGYIAHEWDSNDKCFKNVWREDKRLDLIYQFLEQLGYEKSDEERQIQDGTHPLFDKEVPENEQNSSEC